MSLCKVDIALLLMERFNLRSYLEIATPGTGNEFAAISKRAPRHYVLRRAMYRCPRDWTDNLPIHWRSAEPSNVELVKSLAGTHYDLVFVDAWHEYEAARADIKWALELVAPGGFVLVHDCSPPDARCAAPTLESWGCLWSGVSYAAFLAEVLSAPALDYMTVDADFGCGIVSRQRRFAGDRPSPALIEQWRQRLAIEQYSLFDANRAALLRLAPPDGFHERIIG